MKSKSTGNCRSTRPEITPTDAHWNSERTLVQSIDTFYAAQTCSQRTLNCSENGSKSAPHSGNPTPSTDGSQSEDQTVFDKDGFNLLVNRGRSLQLQRQNNMKTKGKRTSEEMHADALHQYSIQDVNKKIYIVQQQLTEYHAVIDKLERTKRRLSEQETTISKQCEKIKEYEKRLSSHDYVKMQNQTLEGEVVNLKLALAQSRSREDWHDLGHRKGSGELDEVRKYAGTNDGGGKKHRPNDRAQPSTYKCDSKYYNHRNDSIMSAPGRFMENGLKRESSSTDMNTDFITPTQKGVVNQFETSCSTSLSTTRNCRGRGQPNVPLQPKELPFPPSSSNPPKSIVPSPADTILPPPSTDVKMQTHTQRYGQRQKCSVRPLPQSAIGKQWNAFGNSSSPFGARWDGSREAGEGPQQVRARAEESGLVGENVNVFNLFQKEGSGGKKTFPGVSPIA